MQTHVFTSLCTYKIQNSQPKSCRHSEGLHTQSDIPVTVDDQNTILYEDDYPMADIAPVPDASILKVDNTPAPLTEERLPAELSPVVASDVPPVSCSVSHVCIHS